MFAEYRRNADFAELCYKAISQRKQLCCNKQFADSTIRHFFAFMRERSIWDAKVKTWFKKAHGNLQESLILEVQHTTVLGKNEE